jgi:uncharacterized protein GlcG (DUF336 family)
MNRHFSRKRIHLGLAVAIVGTLALAGGAVVNAASPLPSAAGDCTGLPSHEEVKQALTNATRQANGGLSNEMWATVENRDGFICVVAFTGDARGDQWPGSRVISAQKANTAAAFSLPPGKGGLFPGLALASGNIYWPVQPGGSLYGLQFSNPVDPAVGFAGDPVDYGTEKDPMIGHRSGGVNVFGGGLALYSAAGIVGAIGVSGDTSCADHIVAWKARDGLGLDHVPNGLSGPGKDNLIYDFPSSNVGNASALPVSSPSGFGHPMCDPVSTAVGNALPLSNPTS